MRNMKRIKMCVVIVLVFCLMLSICTPDVSSAKSRKKGTWGPNMTWELKGSAKKHNQTLYITCNGKMPSLDSVRSPSRKYWDFDTIKKIVVKGNTTSIGQAAFSDLRTVKMVELSNSIKTIGAIAFCATDSLKSVKLPLELRIINRSAFGSSGLKRIVIPRKVKAIILHHTKKVRKLAFQQK